VIHPLKSDGRPADFTEEEAARALTGGQGTFRMTTPIHASALRIGMFVHLNVGWMSHPFPLSSFKL